LQRIFLLFFFHGKLILCAAVSSTDRQASQLAAFLQAEDRPMFKGLKSDSTARSRICLERPTGRLQYGDKEYLTTSKCSKHSNTTKDTYTHTQKRDNKRENRKVSYSNRQCVSIRVTEIFVQGGAMVDPVFSCHLLYVSKTCTFLFFE